VAIVRLLWHDAACPGAIRPAPGRRPVPGHYQVPVCVPFVHSDEVHEQGVAERAGDGVDVRGVRCRLLYLDPVRQADEEPGGQLDQ